MASYVEQAHLIQAALNICMQIERAIEREK